MRWTSFAVLQKKKNEGDSGIYYHLVLVMGFAVYRFVDSVDQNLICGICSAVLDDAVLSPCGHSFCQSCLDRWLDQPGCNSCPECRGRMCISEARPILSIRNLINGLNMRCTYASRGCDVIVTLERSKTHADRCGYAPVKCVGCERETDRQNLPTHQMQCEGIAAAVCDEDRSVRKFTCSTLNRSPARCNQSIHEIAELACKVASLELQVKRLKRDIEYADAKNKRLEREMKKTKNDLQEKRNQLQENQSVELDRDYDYGYTPQSISKLSCLIARFLFRKPAYIDQARIFTCVKRCYEQYARCGDTYEHDVHMLVATAYASDWFSDNQKLSIHCWLQSIARYRRFSHELNARYREESAPSSVSVADTLPADTSTVGSQWGCFLS